MALQAKIQEIEDEVRRLGAGPGRVGRAVE